MQGDDISNIVNTVNLYATAVDTQTWELFDRVFTPDVIADFGGFSWPDLAALKRDFAPVHAPHKATMHTTTNHQVTVTGDRGTCLSYVHGRFMRDVEGGDMFESGGWYDDKLIRTPGGWRIKHRVCRMVWWKGNPRVMETLPDMKAEFQLFSLIADGKARKIGHLDALLAVKD